MSRNLYAAVLGLWCAAAVAAGAQSPQELVQETAERMLAKLRSESETVDNNPGRIYELVDEIVLPHFDFERMSQWVLGKHWRNASVDQRRRFIEQFRTLLVRTYAKSLSEFRDQKIEYLPVRADPKADEVTVSTQVDQPGGFPIPIDYHLIRSGGEWKVYDVTIDSVSLVTNYRTTFSNEVRQGGLDKLIETLAERNRRSDSGG